MELPQSPGQQVSLLLLLRKTIQTLLLSKYMMNYSDKNVPLISTTSVIITQSNILLQPFQLTAKNIYAFPIGIRPCIRTIGFVFPTLIQFFFSMALTKISAPAHIHARLSPLTNYIIGFIFSRLWSFLNALSWARWFFTFSESRTGAKPHTFIIILSMWIYSPISFEYYNICAAYIPMEFLSVNVLTWNIVNVTAAAFPCVLKSAICRVEYAVPSVNVFELFGTILSGGAGDMLGRNLGVFLMVGGYAFRWVGGECEEVSSGKGAREQRERGGCGVG
jgi:hypothetical protein